VQILHNVYTNVNRELKLMHWTGLSSLTPHPTQTGHFGGGFTANHLTVTDKQTIKKLNIFTKIHNKHNTNQRKQTTKQTTETKLP